LEICSRDEWSIQQFSDLQACQLRKQIRHAANHVPFYRRVFKEAGIDPESIKDQSDLVKLPILEKSTVRQQGTALLDERLDLSRLIKVETSGTTGTPLTIYDDLAASSARYAYWDARCRGLVGKRRRHDRSVSLGGHMVTAPRRSRPPFWVHNRRWQQLYMSSYHLSPHNLGHYVEAIRRFDAAFIEGYPSSLYAIARHIVDSEMDPIRFDACFTTAETLLDYQRDAFRQAFCCPTHDQYGCAEMVIFAAECSHGQMHLSPEMGIAEVVDADDRPLPEGQVGSLICTGLVNRAHPLIRYRIGDLGSLLKGSCSCGSQLPRLGRIEGRRDAVILTADGRQIGRLDPVFKGVVGISEAQIVQDDLCRFRIRIVTTEQYRDEHGKRAAQNLCERLGGKAEVTIEMINVVERSRSGKLPAIVCNLPLEERRELLSRVWSEENR
jgi:phenylacetate-CoA ligase